MPPNPCKTLEQINMFAGEGFIPPATTPACFPVGGRAGGGGPPDPYKTSEKSAFSLLVALRMLLAALGPLLAALGPLLAAHHVKAFEKL